MEKLKLYRREAEACLCRVQSTRDARARARVLRELGDWLELAWQRECAIAAQVLAEALHELPIEGVRQSSEASLDAHQSASALSARRIAALLALTRLSG